MSWNPFKKIFSQKSKSYLGIDIGTSSVRLVEISQSVNGQKLENYGSLSLSPFNKGRVNVFKKNNPIAPIQDITRAINSIIKVAKIETKEAVFSLPDFTTFFTNFELPSMKENELEKAIQYEARQHIPLPLKDVFLDWQIIQGKPLKEREISTSKEKKLKILLVAISNKIIKQYQEIATASQLELISLEAEVFSLKRALVKENEKGITALIDVGVRSTTCSIIENAKLENSYSFEMSGEELDEKIAERFNISNIEAEKLRRKYGLLNSEEEGDAKKIYEILSPLIDIILIEIEKTFNNFYQKGGKDVQKIILAGGTALLPGLKEYFENRLKKEIVFAKPFSNFNYLPVLEDKLKELGPGYSIAVGAALRGLE